MIFFKIMYVRRVDKYLVVDDFFKIMNVRRVDKYLVVDDFLQNHVCTSCCLKVGVRLPSQ